MYHGKCIQFTVTGMVGTRDARDLKKEINMENVQGTSDDFIFADFWGGGGGVSCSVVKAIIWSVLTCRNLVYLPPNSLVGCVEPRKNIWHKQNLVITCVRKLNHPGGKNTETPSHQPLVIMGRIMERAFPKVAISSAFY